MPDKNKLDRLGRMDFNRPPFIGFIRSYVDNMFTDVYDCMIRSEIEYADPLSPKDSSVYKKQIREQAEDIKKYKVLHGEFKKDILSSNEKLIIYFKALLAQYRHNKNKAFPVWMTDPALYSGSLFHARYVDDRQSRELCGCLDIEDGHLTKGLEQFIAALDCFAEVDESLTGQS